MLSGRLRVLGEQHPDTLSARVNLAVSYAQAGRISEAITLQEQVLADRVRVLGEQHPDTVISMKALQAWRSDS